MSSKQAESSDDDTKNEVDQSDVYPRFSLDGKVNDSSEHVDEGNTRASESGGCPATSMPDANRQDTHLASSTPSESDLIQDAQIDSAEPPMITPKDSYLVPTKRYSNLGSSTPMDDADLSPTTSTDDSDPSTPATPMDDSDLSTPATPMDDSDLSTPTTPMDVANLPAPTTPTEQSIENILFASPAVYVHEDGKRQTPRRKSSKLRRKSMSQRPFNNIDDSDDDEESVIPPQQQDKVEDSLSYNLSEDAEVFVTPNSSPSVISRNPDKSSSLDEKDINDSFQQRMSSTIMVVSQDNEDEAVVNKTRRRVKRLETTDDEEDIVAGSEEEGGESIDDGGESMLNSPSDDDNTDDEVPVKTKTQRRVMRIESDDEEEDAEDDEGNVREDNQSKEDESEESREHSEVSSDSVSSSQSQEEEEEEFVSSTEGESEESANNRMQKRRVKRLDSSDEEDDDDDESASSSSESKDCHDCSKDMKNVLGNHGNQTAGIHSGESMSENKYRCPNGLHQSNVVKIQRCACVLDDAEKENYTRNIHLAMEEENQGNKDMALDNYLEALKIDSSDLRIHKRALELAKQQHLM